jgi:hypothetical protein
MEVLHHAPRLSRGLERRQALCICRWHVLRPSHHPSGISSQLSAVRRGMEMIGHSMIGQNITQGVAPVSWG